MELQRTANFFDTTSDDKNLPRFVTRKWIEFYDQPGGNYNVNKKIRIKTSMLRADLCDYSNAYIVVKGKIALKGDADANKGGKHVAFKNNAPFINCFSKINGVKIDNAEDLDVAMPITFCMNTVKFTEKQRKVCGIITEMNQAVMPFLPILNLLSIKQILQEKRQKIMIH